LDRNIRSYHLLAKEELKASLALLIRLIENVGFHPSFSRHGRARASLALLIWLTKTLDFILRFLAMAELEQAWLCSSGLRKRSLFMHQPSWLE
jgi:hypothetical protein